MSLALFFKNIYFSSDVFQAGYVLGVRHSDPKKPDLILHFAPTPNGSEDEPPIADLDQLDVAWMKEHHKQIRRMLPGGIDVLGVSTKEAKTLL